MIENCIYYHCENKVIIYWIRAPNKFQIVVSWQKGWEVVNRWHPYLQMGQNGCLNSVKSQYSAKKVILLIMGTRHHHTLSFNKLMATFI